MDVNNNNARRDWLPATLDACFREADPNGYFTRYGLIKSQLSITLYETKYTGKNAQQIVSRMLHSLKQLGLLEAVDQGEWRVSIIPGHWSAEALLQLRRSQLR